VTQEESLDGWNIQGLSAVRTRVPFPMQDDEGMLGEQAQEHLGTHAQRETIVIDRGSLDREEAWRVRHYSTICVICRKATRAATRDAQGRATGERAVGRENVVRQDMAQQPASK
jgi:hypothetical protein